MPQNYLFYRIPLRPLDVRAGGDCGKIVWKIVALVHDSIVSRNTVRHNTDSDYTNAFIVSEATKTRIIIYV